MNQFIWDLRAAIHFNIGADCLSGASADIFPALLQKLEAVCSKPPSHRDGVGTGEIGRRSGVGQAQYEATHLKMRGCPGGGRE